MPFTPSQQMFGAIANAPFNGPDNNPPQMLPPPIVSTAMPSRFDSGDEDPILPPSTPAHPSSTVSSTSTTLKRKYSTLDDGASGSFRTSSVGSYGKRQRNSAPSGALALHGIGDALRDLHGVVHDGPMSQPRHHRRSLAERRIEATALFQNTETLTAEQAIAFADLFEQNTARADTYLALVRANVCELWVQKQLESMGFPTAGSAVTEG